jgi:hypothetical protein
MTNYGEDTVTTESVIAGRQFSLKSPNWFFAQINSDELHDTTNPLALLGGTDEKSVKSIKIRGNYPSYWTDYPRKYKFTGF